VKIIFVLACIFGYIAVGMLIYTILKIIEIKTGEELTGNNGYQNTGIVISWPMWVIAAIPALFIFLIKKCVVKIDSFFKN